MNKHVIIGNAVYRRIEARQPNPYAPSPEAQKPKPSPDVPAPAVDDVDESKKTAPTPDLALVELARDLGFKPNERISLPAVMNRFLNVMRELADTTIALAKDLGKVQKFFRNEMQMKPARAAEILRDYYGGDNAIRNLGNYENPGMMEDWAEFPAKLGMSYVDMSNKLPEIMKKQGEQFDQMGELNKRFRSMADRVADIDPKFAAQVEKMRIKFEGELQNAFIGGQPLNRI